MRETTLGELCAEGGGSIQTGPFGSQLHASDYVADGIPSVMPQNIGDNVISIDDIARITEADAERLSKYLLEENDIVYSRRGDVEKRALIRTENVGWLCGTGCLRIRFGPEAACDPRFVSYYLGTESSRSWIRLHAVGATMPNLNTGILSAFPIELPSIGQQRAIAEVLGALDDKIAANRKLVDAAEQLTALLVRQSASWVPIREVVEYRKISRSPERMGAELVAHYSLPAFDAGQLPEVSAPQDIKSSKFLIEKPSVLISKLNPRFPRVWDVVEMPAQPAYASTEFLVLESPYSSTSVLAALLKHPEVSLQLESKVAGTSGSHQRVKPDDLLETKIPDPRSMDQRAQETITVTGLLASKARDESVQLTTLRDTLLSRLMSGELRVRDAERAVEAAL